MSDCSDLIGRPYRLGADGSGSDGAIDCIHLCYTAFDRLGINAPPFNHAWYDGDRRLILRELYGSFVRIHNDYTDGDLLLIPQNPWAFAVIWSQGVLYIEPVLEKVQWSSLRMFTKARYYRSKSNL